MLERGSADKSLDAMDRLADMGHFPPLVNAGATANILLTLCITWWLEGVAEQRLSVVTSMTPHDVQFWGLAVPLLWVAVVLTLNLTPVVLLRFSLSPTTPYPPLRAMNFVTDQHKFSDWVYLAASANMAFWVLLGWLIFSWRHSIGTLLAVLIIAAIATFSPVLLRPLRRYQG